TRGRFGRRYRARNKPATEHACLTFRGIVEDARLAGRNAMLPVDELDFMAMRGRHQPSGLRRPGRAHLHKHLHSPGSECLLERTPTNPVEIAQQDSPGVQRIARPDDHAPSLAFEPNHIERLAGCNAEAFALPDREIDDTAVMAEHIAAQIDDFAGLGRARLQPLDHIRIMPARHKADVLAVMLVRDRKTKAAGKLTRLRLAALAERKAQQFKLLARRAEQEVALVALLLARAIQRTAAA